MGLWLYCPPKLEESKKEYSSLLALKCIILPHENVFFLKGGGGISIMRATICLNNGHQETAGKEHGKGLPPFYIKQSPISFERYMARRVPERLL